jgi:hypothetical protein
MMKSTTLTSLVDQVRAVPGVVQKPGPMTAHKMQYLVSRRLRTVSSKDLTLFHASEYKQSTGQDFGIRPLSPFEHVEVIDPHA